MSATPIHICTSLVLLAFTIKPFVASLGAFTCSLNITGSSTYSQALKYSDASIRCTSDYQDDVALPMILHQSLQPYAQSVIGKLV